MRDAIDYIAIDRAIESCGNESTGSILRDGSNSADEKQEHQLFRAAAYFVRQYDVRSCKQVPWIDGTARYNAQEEEF
jgi:hypothetical protein